MSSSPQALSVEFVDSIAEIGQEPWNGLAGTQNPFTRYEFLYALESTGCTSQQTGWTPHHVVVRKPCVDASDGLVAVMPLYLKTNSWGEYVFDWSWANAYQSNGFDYYPKFVTAAPFTPSCGRRLFFKSSEDQSEIAALIAEKVMEKAGVIGASSWHVLFPEQDEHELLKDLGIQARIATQFHWKNRDYESFDDFLADLNSRKRKSIRRERKQVNDQSISFRRTDGAEITDQQWADFYLYYQSTYLARGMQGYLKRGFFKLLAATMPEQIFMVNAEKDGQDIAAALFFRNHEKLFGRYWGCTEHHPCLHFELCYYRAIDFAIEQGLDRVEAGAQGEHKLARGYLPAETYSLHWMRDAGFAEAIAHYLEAERNAVEEDIEILTSYGPFRKDNREERQ